MRKGFYRQYIYRFTRMPYGSLFLFVFLAGFLGGILFANVAWNFRRSAVTALNLLSVGSAGSIANSDTSYLRYLAGIRMRAPILLMISGVTACGMIAVYLGLLWYGFLGGLLCSAALLQLGVSGMLKLLFSLLVPVGCYVPVTIILLNQVFQMSERSGRKEVLNIREYGRYLLICLVLLAAYGIGILAECYVNPVFMGLLGKT